MNKTTERVLMKTAMPQKWIARALLLGGSAVLLAACQTTPLPPWQGAPAGGASPARGGAVAPPTASGYSAAVAARYPEPAVRYHTPGLQAGRGQVTTNAEIQTFLAQLAGSRAANVQLRVDSIGRSQQGQDIHAIFLAQGAQPGPAGFEGSGKPAVLLVGGQHGDAPAGSEALLVVAQQLAQGDWSRLLERVNVIIVPRANPDGAGANTRELANWLDLDHDHLLLRTPEARALAQLVRDFRPLVVLDSQEYPVAGSFQQKFQAVPYHDALLQYATAPNIAEFVSKAANEWFAEPVFAALRAQNLSADWYYRTSPDLQDRTLAMGGTGPESLRNLGGLRNAVSLQVLSRGAGLGSAHIQRRVHTHVTAAGKVLEQTAARAAHLAQVRSFVIRDAASQACRGRLVVDAAQTPQQRSITALDPASGADKTLNVSWQSSLELRPVRERPRPCGYLIAAAERDAVERLQLLGVTVLKVAEPGALQVQRYGGGRKSPAQPGAQAPAIEAVTSLNAQRAEVPAGSYYVPLGQPLAHLAAAALEPDAPDSYFANQAIRELGSVVRVVEPPALVFEEID